MPTEATINKISNSTVAKNDAFEEEHDTDGWDDEDADSWDD